MSIEQAINLEWRQHYIDLKAQFDRCEAERVAYLCAIHEATDRMTEVAKEIKRLNADIAQLNAQIRDSLGLPKPLTPQESEAQWALHMH